MSFCRLPFRPKSYPANCVCVFTCMISYMSFKNSPKAKYFTTNWPVKGKFPLMVSHVYPNLSLLMKSFATNLPNEDFFLRSKMFCQIKYFPKDRMVPTLYSPVHLLQFVYVFLEVNMLCVLMSLYFHFHSVWSTLELGASSNFLSCSASWLLHSFPL